MTEQAVQKTGEPDESVRYWLAEISASRKREKTFRTEGERLRKIYAGEKEKQTPFNILFSNTETLAPALYSQTPRPVVQRRYKDDDPIGLAAAKAAQRALEFMLDTNLEGLRELSTMRAAVRCSIRCCQVVA
jgi:hypothetical protein